MGMGQDICPQVSSTYDNLEHLGATWFLPSLENVRNWQELSSPLWCVTHGLEDPFSLLQFVTSDYTSVPHHLEKWGGNRAHL